MTKTKAKTVEVPFANVNRSSAKNAISAAPPSALMLTIWPKNTTIVSLISRQMSKVMIWRIFKTSGVRMRMILMMRSWSRKNKILTMLWFKRLILWTNYYFHNADYEMI